MVAADELGDWAGRRVFITGHMGFKGSWLCALLSRLGAETTGFGFDHRPRLLYPQLRLQNHLSVEGDVNDHRALQAAMATAAPEVIVHLAAQPLVLASFDNPVSTFETNIIGTVKVLEAVRRVPGVKAVLIVTSDKVYRNEEHVWAYRETDTLGGADPYSASKAAAELVAASMASSFFADGQKGIATVRAGNVIGGGDWADDRLLPDAARAFETGQPLVLRNPEAVRPWQHVLDPLTGYLVLANHLLNESTSRFGCWNFGPSGDNAATVRDVAKAFATNWGAGAIVKDAEPRCGTRKETHFLTVDSTRARRLLGWRPRWDAKEAVRRAAVWYRRCADGEDAALLVADDIESFLAAAP
ncbi:CDP-glucose 4,6-dehydratase [Roseitalea porphyridii]|uniref:CDP-glucose 4,6-dehydratase n=1 Tax=Roseitalea porphyridii TaxID=1852022 RepID=A0A4P6V284_9HYPH|nr:CDP-glucose 4,6-dehydratase [Roseitalea porphyridii]QBK30814.1 CDP-glucose 4,6-dehydratase [Roseitalea porphyridii]